MLFTRALRGTGLGLAAALTVMFTALPAEAQCPNNCTGHGTCVPSPKTRRFECECYDGWTGSACSRRESESAQKAKAEEPEMIVDVPEDEPLGEVPRRGRPASGVREFDEVASDRWKALRPREQVLLKDLGWEGKTWDAKRSPRTIWPQAMQLPFNGLKPREQSAVIGLGLTENDWDTGKALAILMQNSV